MADGVMADGVGADAAALLELAGVHTHIGRYHIVQGADFAVPAGGPAMLLGRHGAGKTPTLRTLMGLWRASASRPTLQGRDIPRPPTPAVARPRIAPVP